MKKASFLSLGVTSLLIGFVPGLSFAFPHDANGYNQFPLPALKIYVSSSTGSNSNDGFSEARPVATIAKARDQMRNYATAGTSYAVLLKAGDQFTGGFIQWCHSGKSAAEPSIIGKYGTSAQRPIVNVQEEAAVDLSCSSVSNLVIADIQFRTPSNDNRGSTGIRAVSGGSNLYIENITLGDAGDPTRGFKDGIILGPGVWTNVSIRYSAILDSYAPTGYGHSQGIFADGSKGLLVEGCVFDHNGWNPKVAGAEPTIFNHNFYINGANEGFVARNNIITNASSHGVSSNANGITYDNGSMIKNNYFGQNAFNIFMRTGYSQAIDNVIEDVKDISPGLLRGIGISVGTVETEHPPINPGPALVQNNLIRGRIALGQQNAIEVKGNIPAYHSRVDVVGNVVYHWNTYNMVEVLPQATTTDVIRFIGNSFQALAGFMGSHAILGANALFQSNIYSTYSPNPFRVNGGGSKLTFNQWKGGYEPGAVQANRVFPDSTRSVGKYSASLGGAPNLAGFLREARKISRDNFRRQYTADALNNYMRTGFGMSTSDFDPLDFNKDGFVNGEDFDLFTNRFIQGDMTADFDRDGFVSGEDFDAFASAFSSKI